LDSSAASAGGVTVSAPAAVSVARLFGCGWSPGDFGFVWDTAGAWRGFGGGVLN